MRDGHERRREATRSDREREGEGGVGDVWGERNMSDDKGREKEAAGRGEKKGKRRRRRRRVDV